MIGESYSEDHAALRWPLVLLGTLLPVIVVAATVLGAVAHSEGVLPIVAVALLVLVFTDARHLVLVWPIGLRIDAAGIRIGGVRRAERRPGRGPSAKAPPPSFQGYHVFECPWKGIRSLTVISDRRQLRQLEKRSRNAPTSKIERRGGLALGYYLGMLAAPFMRAALVIEVDPAHARYPTFRVQQALSVATSQQGTRSTTWFVPTRHPERLSAVIDRITASPAWLSRQG